MSRAIMLLAVLAILTLRFVDGAAHAHAHDRGTPADAAIVLLDEDGCGNDDFHAAAHCASHMADSLQRSMVAAFKGAVAGPLVPVAWSTVQEGRNLSPPVRPPLA